MDRPFHATADGPVPFTDDEMAQLAIDQAAAARAAVPQSVSAFQAKAALDDAGLSSQVAAILAAGANRDRLAWTDSIVFERQSPTLLKIAAALKLTDAQVDALFIAAAQIKA